MQRNTPRVSTWGCMCLPFDTVDGLTATRKIREYEAQGKLTGHIPIIAVTANARSEQIAAALHAGMVSRLCILHAAVRSVRAPLTVVVAE